MLLLLTRYDSTLNARQVDMGPEHLVDVRGELERGGGPNSITSVAIGPSYVSLPLRSSVTTIGPEPTWSGDTFVL
jgi:hypothetical protein